MLSPSLLHRLYSRESRRRTHTAALRNLAIFCLPLAGVAFFSACTAIPARQAPVASVINQLRDDAAIGGGILPDFAEENVPDANILYLGKEATDLLDSTVLPLKYPHLRLKAIVEILNEKVHCATEADKFTPKTAMETYETGTGNCLSFTNLFVAMARYVGIEAGYQEVSIPPSRDREGKVIFVSRHISGYTSVYNPHDCNVQLVLLDDDRPLVQSNGYFFKFTTLDGDISSGSRNGATHEPIEDHRAFAQHYNNVASMHMAEGDLSGALRYFRKALTVDPDLDFVWSNLGVAYSRNHQLAAAEEAFMQALSVAQASKNMAAVSSIINNMVKLYERGGNTEKAAFLKNEVAASRKDNPFYYYLAGKKALSNACYEDAVKHFKVAIRKKGDEDTFYYSLALAYLKLGDLRRAEKCIDKAIVYACNDRKRVYYDKVLAEISRTAVN